MSQPHLELPIAFGFTPDVPAEHFAPGSLDPRVVHRLGFAFTPDSRNVITTEPDGALSLWDARTVRQTESLARLGSNCWQVALSPDGQWLAAGEATGCVRVWDWPARRLVAILEFPYEFAGHLGFSRSGRFLTGNAAMNDHRFVSRIWRTNGWEAVPFFPLEQLGVRAFTLSPDDQLVAAGYVDGTLRLWAFPSARLEAALKEHTTWVSGLAFSPNGGRLASVDIDSQALVWDVVKRRKLETLRGHSSIVWSVAFSPDGKRLLTGAENPTEAVKLWDLASERELLTFRGLGQHFMEVGFSPDGKTIMATSLGGIAHLWRAPSWEEIKAAEAGMTSP